ncbi:MAG: hypothetical protein WGN25_01020 [Candidatus Electrothrix sp. GW3-4]|uniref:hypothetical protein n=1 Tax=Candidatus Electrothrix sp. GW3-4 TaxID=3126740 RepID=UPI0030D0973F
MIEQLAVVLNVDVVSPMEGAEAQALHKALPGYQAVADEAARFIQEHGEALHLEVSVLANLIVSVTLLRPIQRLPRKENSSLIL